MTEKTRLEQDPRATYYANPEYGTGVFRRRIRLVADENSVTGELEDCCHGFRSRIEHKDGIVTAVSADALRIPLSTCGGAVNPIKALVGVSLAMSPLDINLTVNPRTNCTHLYDLSVLAIAHAQRGGTRVIDIEVSDETEQPSDCKVSIDGKLIHHWQASNFSITAPLEFKDNVLWKGFASWANKAFTGDEMEAAFALQKGYFVSQARRYDMTKVAGLSVAGETMMHGSCYSYTPGIVEAATRTSNSTRDFSDTPEQLLKFL